jgi:hypothetical protein
MRARAWCPPTRPAPVGHRRVGAGRPAAVRLRPGHPVALPVPGHLGLPVAARGRPTATKQTPCSRPGRARHPTSGHASQPTRKGKSSAEPSRSTEAECSPKRPPGPSLHRTGRELPMGGGPPAAAPGRAGGAARRPPHPGDRSGRSVHRIGRRTRPIVMRPRSGAIRTVERRDSPTNPRRVKAAPRRGAAFTTADSPVIQPRPAPRWGRCGAPAASARSCCST